MKELLQELLVLKEKEREIKERRTVLEGEIYDLVSDKLDDDKSVSFFADEIKLVVKPNYAVKVDQELAKTMAGHFKTKYELSYSQYKKTNGAVDSIVTITQNKPTFVVSIKD